ncbi:hypothetical protein ALC57_08907 [Trachymyrmex cornetzi]|uniref:Uncharacterized protein n=1 Tax=Trachymyrmex cornetzi TaxID=471704 RepID=A0A151J6E9_9HYME|nr:hypothetical protein ALC57_08907 [Trachymyrmex cornetzi]
MCGREYSKLYTSTTCNTTSSYSEHTGCVFLDLQPRNSSTVEEKARLIRSTLTHMPEQNNNNDSLNTQILSLQDDIKCIGQLHSIKVSKCNKQQIKEQLISSCDKNEDDIIILMGNTTTFMTLSDVAYKAIEEIIDKNISESINIWISKLTEEVTHLFNRINMFLDLYVVY